MKARIILLAGLLIGLGGCTHRVLLPGAGAPDAYQAANAALRERPAQLRLADGRHLALFDVRVAADSSSGLLAKTGGERRTLANGEIAEIRLLRRVRGACEGLATGLVAGLVLFGPIAQQEDGFFAGAFAGLTVAASVLVGVPSGAIHGDRLIYTFASASSTPPAAADGADPPPPDLHLDPQSRKR